MNNILTVAALLLGGYWLYNKNKAQELADEKEVDDQAATNPMIADVYALKNAISPNYDWLNRFNEADTQSIYNILKKYGHNSYNEFAALFYKKYHVNLTDLINQKLTLSASDKALFAAIINGTVTTQQRLPYETYNGSTIPTGKTITFLQDGYIFNSDDITEDIADQLPDRDNPDMMQGLKTKGSKTFSYKTTGLWVNTSKLGFMSKWLGIDNIWAQLATDDKKSIRWVLVIDNDASGVPLVAFNF